MEAATGPGLSVDVNASRHAISPYVYGINYTQNLIPEIHPGIIRWGGDATSEYNWQTGVTNSGSDWYFMDCCSPAGQTFEQFFAVNHAAGVATLGTIPILGWVADSGSACAFSIQKYGPQQCVNPYASDCGNGIAVIDDPSSTSSQTATCNDGSHVSIPAGKNWKAITQVTTTNPADADAQVTPSFMQSWVSADVAQLGSTAAGGVFIWSLDNEPVWWDSVHQAVHPTASTYDDIWQRGLANAEAIKAADPTAKVSGPVTAGWWDLFFSKQDLNSGWGTSPYQYWDNPVDRLAHGNMDFAAWYLQQFANYEKQSGQRLLDYFEVHGYMPGTGGDAVDAASNAARLESTRVFWDEGFTPPNTNEYILNTPENPANMPPNPCICLIPRMKNWVNTYYPGTKIGISEYTLGAQTANDVNGGVAEADLLGIFGREGVDLATLWPARYPNLVSTDPVTYAFRLYRNYDGAGGEFGDTGVAAVSANQSQLSIYAAQRTADAALTVVVVNKTPNDLAATVSLAHFTPQPNAAVYRYSASNATAIVAEALQPVTAGGFTATFPANSATLYVLPQGGPPSLSITPDPIVLTDSSTAGTATVAYSASVPVEVYIGSTKFCGGSASGTCQTGAWVTNGMVFSLVDASSGKTLATATARVRSKPTMTSRRKK